MCVNVCECVYVCLCKVHFIEVYERPRFSNKQAAKSILTHHPHQQDFKVISQIYTSDMRLRYANEICE